MKMTCPRQHWASYWEGWKQCEEEIGFSHKEGKVTEVVLCPKHPAFSERILLERAGEMGLWADFRTVVLPARQKAGVQNCRY